MRSHGAPVRRKPALAQAIGLGLTVLGLAGTSGCGQAPGEHPRGQTAPLRVATVFAPLSTRLMEEYRRTLPTLEIQEVRIGSSIEMLPQVEAGTIDVGIALADDAYRAYWGSGPGDAPSASTVRGISLLQPLPMYLVVRGGSGIRHVSELKGRVVAVGPPDTSSWTLGHLVLKAFKAEPVTVRPFNSREDAAAEMKDGSVDAMVLPGLVDPDQMTLAVIRDGAQLIPIEGPPIDDLRREAPFVRSILIPRGIYPGQDRIVATVGIDLVIVCRADLDEALVYQLTQQLFNVFPRISRSEATLRFLNVEEAPATPIPLHPGAARYFRERELSR